MTSNPMACMDAVLLTRPCEKCSQRADDCQLDSGTRFVVLGLDGVLRASDETVAPHIPECPHGEPSQKYCHKCAEAGAYQR